MSVRDGERSTLILGDVELRHTESGDVQITSRCEACTATIDHVDLANAALWFSHCASRGNGRAKGRAKDRRARAVTAKE